MSDHNRAILRQIPLFRDFSDAACDAVIAVLRVRQFSPGETVFRQGDRGDTMVIVSTGHLRVELLDGHNTPTNIGAIGPGEVVGEMAVLDPAPRASSVISVSETTVYELNREGLQLLRQSSPAASAAIVSAVISDVTRRLRQANQRIDKVLNPRTSGLHKVEAAAAKTVQEPAETPSLLSRIWARLTGD